MKFTHAEHTFNGKVHIFVNDDDMPHYIIYTNGHVWQAEPEAKRVTDGKTLEKIRTFLAAERELGKIGEVKVAVY